MMTEYKQIRNPWAEAGSRTLSSLGVTVRIPAKVMLFGEYSVLEGGDSLTLTPDLWMEVQVRPLPSATDQVFLSSDLWDEELHLSREELSLAGKNSESSTMTRTLAAAVQYLGFCPASFSVRSGWDIRDGMGSSSALRLGLWFGLSYYIAGQQPSQSVFSHSAMLRRIWQEQSLQQGFGSGYDLAAQYLGGLVRFSFSGNHWPQKLRRETLSLQRLRDSVHIFRGGSGAPTGRTGRQQLAWLKAQGLQDSWKQSQEEGIYSMMHFLSNGTSGEDETAYKQVLATFENIRHLAQEGPAFPSGVSALLRRASEAGQRWSWKPSGAGGEDALILFGSVRDCGEAFRCLESAGWTKLENIYHEAGLKLSLAEPLPQGHG